MARSVGRWEGYLKLGCVPALTISKPATTRRYKEKSFAAMTSSATDQMKKFEKKGPKELKGKWKSAWRPAPRME
jgi:hypothetical protein